MLVYMMAISGALIGPLIAPALIYTEMDPFHFIFEAYFAPNPYERTIPCILFLLGTRLVLSYLCVIEFIRIAIIFAITIILLVFTGINILCRLDTINNIDVTYKFYSQLKIAFAAVFEKLKIITLLLVFGSQAVTVMTLWLTLKCWNVIPLFISLACVLFSLYAVIVESLLITALANVEEESLVLLVRKQNRYYCRNFKSRHLYLPYIKWKAQQPISIPCGNLFIFQKSTVSTYFSQMFGNLTNSVILIEP